jgi:hypothetical protein
MDRYLGLQQVNSGRGDRIRDTNGSNAQYVGRSTNFSFGSTENTFAASANPKYEQSGRLLLIANDFPTYGLVRLPPHPVLGAVYTIIVTNSWVGLLHPDFGLSEGSREPFIQVQSIRQEEGDDPQRAAAPMVGGGLGFPTDREKFNLELVRPQAGNYIRFIGTGTCWMIQGLSGNWVHNNFGSGPGSGVFDNSSGTGRYRWITPSFVSTWNP